ncbi:MAG: hypothetical protein HFJ11_01390 [Bacilli bacterium]|nr:hypothetical protein [Bacilli bacterium]
MQSSAELEAKKRIFVENKGKVQSTANNLKRAIDELEKVKENNKEAYQIDGDGVAKNFIKDLYEKETKLHSNLVNNIIPNIVAKIEDLDASITEARIAESLANEE